MKDSQDTIPSCQEDKQEVVEEQHKTESDGRNEKKSSDQDKVPNKTLSQPAVFVPVDRAPEIQVCVRVCARVPERDRPDQKTTGRPNGACFVRLPDVFQPAHFRRPD